MSEQISEEVKGLPIGLHVLSISLTLLRVTDPLPEKMEDAMIELVYHPREPSRTLVQGFPFKDKFSLSMQEIESLVSLFNSIKSAEHNIEEIISNIGV